MTSATGSKSWGRPTVLADGVGAAKVEAFEGVRICAGRQPPANERSWVNFDAGVAAAADSWRERTSGDEPAMIYSTSGATGPRTD